MPASPWSATVDWICIGSGARGCAAALADLQTELIKGQRLARDENGAVLVWIGAAVPPPAPAPTPLPATAPPRVYTPPYLVEKILTTRSALAGERKQVTVLFADLKGSTELIRDLDPEAAQALLDPALQRMMDAVHRFEGTVNQVLGDGIEVRRSGTPSPAPLLAATPHPGLWRGRPARRGYFAGAACSTA